MSAILRWRSTIAANAMSVLRFGDAEHVAGVLGREEALRHDDVKPDRADDGRERHHQHDRLVREHPVERPFVGVEHGSNSALERAQHEILLSSSP